ncbi:MAG: ferritin family protein [Candidatus Aminicenantes bacterium]|nr:ferritin family protein [Candidatus Aminicenantes bacterium]
MDKKEFNEILDFAVEREQEAVKFYQDLQNMVQFKEKQALLKEFEEIEKSHIVILENIRKNVIEDLKAPLPDIENLAISDYLLNLEPSEDMTYQDILITAMKREEKAQKLYSDLASKTNDDWTKKLFLKLATEESKHKLYFEKLYDEDVLTEN